VDSAWEQEKLEARKMLDAKRAVRPKGSPTRQVNVLLAGILLCKTLLAVKSRCALIIHDNDAI
jgi:hypothetical protein